MEIFCNKCGSKLEYYQRKPGSNTELAVEPCPVCSVQVIQEVIKVVETAQVPEKKKPIEKKVVTIPNIPKKKKK